MSWDNKIISLLKKQKKKTWNWEILFDHLSVNFQAVYHINETKFIVRKKFLKSWVKTMSDYQGCNLLSVDCVPFPWAQIDSSHFSSPHSGPGGRCTRSQRVSRIKERTDIKVHIHNNSCGKSQSVLSRYYHITKLIKSPCFQFLCMLHSVILTSFQYLSLQLTNFN